jgi:hypothetical protein
VNSRQLISSERAGAYVVTRVGDDYAQYDPRHRGDRLPWRKAGPADDGSRFANNEVVAKWSH